MPYSIDRYNGTTIAVVEDGTVDGTLDIKLIGKNYAGYGEVQNENFVHLLENFSSPNAPPRAISGQVWYDSATKKLKFYDGVKFRTTGGAEVSDTRPIGLTTGDFWFDTANDQLYAWNGLDYVLIGPQAAEGSGTTQMRSRSVKDTLGGIHAIIEAVINDATVYVISVDEFTLDDNENPIPGFATIKKGLTLINTPASGITSTTHYHWGTASNALKLEGYSAADFLLSSNLNFSGIVRFADVGFTVGDDNDLGVFIRSGTVPVIKNYIGNTITFEVNSGGNTVTPMKIEGAKIVPGTNNTIDIGSTTFKYANVYATTFNGAATSANALDVGGVARTASITAGINTIAARDSSGNLTANVFNGVATSARYADLAEKYLPDDEYAPGTVVTIGGAKEITAANTGDLPIGVISLNPAFMMNQELEGGIYVALKGRVPVRVIGSVNKGDKLVSSKNGCAIALKHVSIDQQVNVFAIALEDSILVIEKNVEAVIL